jgi:hypothetical protein
MALPLSVIAAVEPRANVSAVAITDTSPEAQAIQFQIQHEMSGEQRMLLTFEMSEFSRKLARAGIRRNHPEWSKAEVARELLRLAFLPEPLPAWLEERLTNSMTGAKSDQ